ncbi:LLM class flavin-dependent oxidoreductase [Streptomyces sp. NBC_01408]|uniref:LLM class flavin-dependent oxidoreductase n=1 Tax=Streptomyces sp. NBC_01408 TaxID=2903855 RepID=UPI00225A8CBC|nr:LLM class flavin-dependent oxidoreductase [Streptomyces sp. NBC_01408]MCX4695653.1 LLM class flavin-dependent oxidoreductase [Streptomyces sp. NBC_01408]
MTQRDGRITLFTRLITGPGAADGASPDSGAGSFARVRGRAREAEAAGIDALLLHDRQSAAHDPADDPHFEAGTLAAALAVCTRTVGLVASISTEHTLPYHAARVLATADHLAPGRAGWQPLTGADPDAAANYSRTDRASADARRSRASEFVTVLTGLWDSFDDDAFRRDRESGVYFTPEKLHALDHKGEYFDVAGPLNIARPPQGHPVLVHRARDADDLALAARIADVVLLPAQDDQSPARVRESVREQARAAGRDAGDIAVLLDIPVDGSPGAADQLRALFDAGAADGFTLLAPAGPAGASHDAVLALAAEVRGEGGGQPSAPAEATLRERLGLPRPAGRYHTA